MERRIAVVGLGYVGLPLALALSEHFKVVGFDINKEKISSLSNGVDPTKENDLLKVNGNISFTSDEKELFKADFIIVVVPTPVTKANLPNLTYLEKASEVVGRNLQKNSIVVYESTVYPGVTEEICLPILEKTSGLKVIQDLSGHGTGKAVHEKPTIYNFGVKNHGIEIKSGDVLAIEPMFSLKSEKIINKNKWSIKTKNNDKSAHFEHTVIVTQNGVEIIT